MTAKKVRVKVAWSDDLSYDSEEEREKERLAQIARELAEQPAKPTYAAGEVEQLISFIVDMTTLYDLQKNDWNDDVLKTIEDWIMEPKALMLTIYFRGEVLRACFDVPVAPVYDLSYFLRTPDHVFTVENFHEEVTFGTFVDSVESNMVSVLETLYAPYFFSITTWPESVKGEFCGQLHTFLAKLTDVYYKMLGLTVLYIPREGQNLSFEVASTDRELAKRLEGVVVYWTHQIKSCIEDQFSVASGNELLCPSDEFDFWTYRHENLSAIQYQIKDPAVRHIKKVLLATHSTFLTQFQTLCEDIVQRIAEAKSNIEYLQVLNQPCALLESAAGPDEIPQHIPRIMNLFRFIWTESPYYNTEARITNLFKSLGNQVIILCRSYIKLDELFDGRTKKALGDFAKCIDCCRQYKEIYEIMCEAHNEREPDSWALDISSIFNYIDSFVQRCVDMLDVCNCMIIFGRIDELEPIKKPIFGGARGDEFEGKCDQIESTFHEALNQIKAVSHTILDVQAHSWYDDVMAFRNTMKEIEIIIENLVESVFEGVNHVEEGVIALYSLNNYSRRRSLKRIFKRKTAEVWAMYNEEVQEAKNEMVIERSQYPTEMPSYAGRAALLIMKKNRLVYLKKVLEDAAWMTACSNADEVLINASRLTAAIDLAVRELRLTWARGGAGRDEGQDAPHGSLCLTVVIKLESVLTEPWICDPP
ncbi:Dynein-1-beta heavy chain, flagellar inner arm I1 complex [Eumeta japonica]|uniref:Dynein-1-beta heavy chain, flagellar inner arm I1 complex n=1 Tax=Eumeta variegata TaxID=151549 RepID=A0A4C1SCB2_EUMVA|nr:Dynein-1-beta heavy chain, flagellar inner arm I1 complex [Eumeta japonica]